MEKDVKERLAFNRFEGRKKKDFHFSWPGSPKSKNSISKKEADAFSAELAREFSGRFDKPVRVPMAVSLSVFVSGKTPPSIHKVPKNYLDLCTGVVFKDDSQIEYLSVCYHVASSGEGGVRFRFSPLSTLRQNLKMANDAVVHSSYRRGGDDLNNLAGQHDDDFDDSLQDWKRQVRDHDKYVQRLGKDVAQNLLEMSEQSAQEHVLKTTALSLGEVEALLSSKPRRRKKRGDEFQEMMAEMREVEFRDKTSLAKMIQRGGLRVKVFQVPVRAGDGKKFKREIRDQLDDFRKRANLFSRLHCPVGLEVLFSPPARDESLVRDIDNVMLKISPIFNELFSPPITHMHAKNLATLPPDLQAKYREWLKPYPSGLRYQIVSYEVFKVPVEKSVREEGQVSIGLCTGQLKRDWMSRAEEIIEKWWEKREDEW